jgi:transcription antitermination factor NusA-like protein
MADVKADIERMLDVVVEKVEEAEDKLVIYVGKDKIGRAIGPNGSVVRSVELILGRAVEVRGI